MMQQHQRQKQLASQITQRMLGPVKDLVLDQIKQNASNNVQPINSMPQQVFASGNNAVSNIFNKQAMNSQATEQIVLQYDKQKETQMLHISSTMSTVNVTLSGLNKNFADMSGSFSYRGNDCNYYVNRIVIPNSIPNVSRSMSIKIKADLVMIEKQTGRFFTLTNRIDNESIPDYLDTQNETEGGSDPLEIKIFQDDVTNYDGLNNHWSGASSDTRTDIMSASELQESVQQQINKFIVDTELNIQQQQDYELKMPNNFRNLYLLFKSTQLVLDQGSGKFGFKTSNLNLTNKIRVKVQEGVDLQTYEEDSLILVHYTLQCYSNESRQSNNLLISRFLGFDMFSEFYAGSIINSQSTIIKLAYDNQNSQVLSEGVVNKFPYPSNMFPTDYIHVQTTLNTNSWDCNGKGKSNTLLEYFMNQTPLQATTPWEQRNQQALHQESIDGLRNFSIFLTDQFGEPVWFLQSKFHLQICVEFKQRNNNQIRTINSV